MESFQTFTNRRMCTSIYSQQPVLGPRRVKHAAYVYQGDAMEF